MSKDIKIKKGLTIRLKGEADKTLSNAPRSRTFAIRPSDLHLVTPKMVVKEGAKVKAGDTLFYSKDNENMKFSSPVSGTLTEILRGPKRVITMITLEGDQQDTFRDFGVKMPDSMDAEAVKNHLLLSGCWPFIKQRPYDVIANPDVMPKAIFVSGLSTGPLAADLDFTLKGKEKELQVAISALAKLTEGAVHVTVGKDGNSPLAGLNDAVQHRANNLHPAGNVGTQINKIDPVNKGETVWTVAAQDLVIIGELFLTGKYNAERIVALAGSSVKAPKYYRTRLGSEVSTIIYDSGMNEENVRVISGDVLSGKAISLKQHLGFYNNLVSVIPEGDDYEFFGWNKPIFNKISTS